MNPMTGHLVSDINTIDDRFRADYAPVPDSLNRAARRKLAGRPEARVSLTSGGKLSKHAAEQRRAKRKAEKAARARNRT